MQTSDIEFIEKIVTRVSKEIEWIEMQLEQKPELISKTNHGYVTKRQEFLQLLRKQQTIKHTLECELDNARGKTAKGEEAQLYRFSGEKFQSRSVKPQISIMKIVSEEFCQIILPYSLNRL